MNFEHLDVVRVLGLLLAIKAKKSWNIPIKIFNYVLASVIENQDNICMRTVYNSHISKTQQNIPTCFLSRLV